jgi:hypothetical protein
MPFEYGEFVNEPILPLRTQTAIHLHDRDGLGDPLQADNGSGPQFPDINYSPGSWSPYLTNGRDGLDGLQGLRGKTGPGGMKGAPGKSTIGLLDHVLLDTNEDFVFELLKGGKAIPWLNMDGMFRSGSGTVQNLDAGARTFSNSTEFFLNGAHIEFLNSGGLVWEVSDLPTSDPGSNGVWLSPT